jgi:hypothetical protein
MLKAMQKEKVLESTAPQDRDSIEVMRATLGDADKPEDVLPQTLAKEKSVVPATNEQDIILLTEEEAPSTSAKGKKTKKNKKVKRGSQQLESELANLPERPAKEDQILPSAEKQQDTVEREILEPSFPEVSEENFDVVKEQVPMTSAPGLWETRDIASVPELQQQAVERQVLEPAFADAKEEKKVDALDFLDTTSTIEQKPEPAAIIEAPKAPVVETVEQPRQIQEPEPEPVKSTWGTGLLGAFGWGKKRATSPTPTPEVKKVVEEKSAFSVPPAPVVAAEEKKVEPEAPESIETPKEQSRIQDEQTEPIAAKETSREIVDEAPVPQSSFVVPQNAYFTDGGKPSFTFPVPSITSAQVQSNDQTLDRELPGPSDGVSREAQTTHSTSPPHNAVFTDGGKPSFTFPAFSTTPTREIAPVTVAEEEVLKGMPLTVLSETRSDVPAIDEAKLPASLPVEYAPAEATSSKKKKAKKDKKKRESVAAPEIMEAEPMVVEASAPSAVDEAPVFLCEPERLAEDLATQAIAPEKVALPDSFDDLDEPTLPVVDVEPVRPVQEEGVPEQRVQVVRDALELPKETSPVETPIVTEDAVLPTVDFIEEDTTSSKKKGKKAKKAKRGSMQVDESEPSTPTVERSLDMSLAGPSETIRDVGVDVPLPVETVQEKNDLIEIPETLLSLDQQAQDRALDLAATTPDVTLETPPTTEEPLPSTTTTAPLKKKGKKNAKSRAQTPEVQAEPVASTTEPLVVAREVQEVEILSQPIESAVVDTVLPEVPIELERGAEVELTVAEEVASPASKKKKKGKKSKGTETPVETESELVVKPEDVKLPDNDLERELELKPIATELVVDDVVRPENVKLPEDDLNDELEVCREVVEAEPQLDLDSIVQADKRAASPPSEIIPGTATREIINTIEDASSPVESAPVASQLEVFPTPEEQPTHAAVPTVEDDSATPSSAKKDKKKKKGKKSKIAEESEPSTPIAELQRELELPAEPALVEAANVEPIAVEPTIVEPTVVEPVVEHAVKSESTVEVPAIARDLPTEVQILSEPTADMPAPVDESARLATPIEDEYAATPKKSKKKAKKSKSVEETPAADTTEITSTAPEPVIKAVFEEPKDIALPLETAEELAPAPVDEPSEVALPVEIAGELAEELPLPVEVPSELVESTKSVDDAVAPTAEEPTRDIAAEEEPASTPKKSKKKKGKKAAEVVESVAEDMSRGEYTIATSTDASEPTTTEAGPAPPSEPIVSVPIVEPEPTVVDEAKDIALPVETAEELASVPTETSREIVSESTADATVPVSRDLAEQVVDEEPASTAKKNKKKKKGKKATEVIESAAEVTSFSEPALETPAVESEAMVATVEPKDVALPLETADEFVSESQETPLPAETPSELVAEPTQDAVVPVSRWLRSRRARRRRERRVRVRRLRWRLVKLPRLAWASSLLSLNLLSPSLAPM